jgi:hypothetical protein
MNFDEDRLAADPTYAPGLSWSGRFCRWRAPRKYLELGYPVKFVALPPGAPDDEHQPARALACRQHTMDLLRWWRKQNEADADFGTWAYVIRRFRTDPYSPYAEIKANTRKSYDYLLDKWQRVIGHMRYADLNWTAIKEIEARMKEKGRGPAYIKRMMGMLRTVAKYGGFPLQMPEVREVSMVLSQMRFTTPRPRDVAPTREQVYAIVAAADAAGDEAVAAGLILQFELAMRAVDVRGQWFEITEAEFGQGGIVRAVEREGRIHFSRWQDGLTWEMFTSDLSAFTKVMSKTERVDGEAYTFDLTPLPDLRDRLRRLRGRHPTGPVIVSNRYGLPYEHTAWSAAFRRYRDAAGVPAEIRAMDLRAGGLTEAKSLGADPYSLRDAGQHKQVSTTDKYARARSASANKVIQLRQGNRT